MTRKQITKKLIEAGLTEDQFKVLSTKTVEIAVDVEDSRADLVLTEEAAEKAVAALQWGGYRCGWNGWVLKADYTFKRSTNIR